MSDGRLNPELRVVESPGRRSVIVEGDLTSDNAAQFEQQLRALSARPGRAMTLDFSGLDIDDGIALATTINLIRELGARSARIILVGAPQVLGHNLYRAGLLDACGGVELIDMRLDEPAGF